MKLIFGYGAGIINNGKNEWSITVAPVFSFPFDGLFYSTDCARYIKIIGEGSATLTIDEMAEIVAYIVSKSMPAPAPLTPAQIAAQNEIAIQDALDSMAQSRGYMDIKSACAYASTVPAVASTDPHFAICEKFRIEGSALQAWMSVTWATAYAYLSTVMDGTNPMPTQEQAVAMMPAFTWPD